MADVADKEAWSELVVRIDNHMLLPQSRKILIRCETNIYNLYRGAAEAELRLNDESYLMYGGGKVSPTTDQRSSGSSKGDPGNSALHAGAVHLFGNRKISLFVIIQALIMIWRINSFGS